MPFLGQPLSPHFHVTQKLSEPSWDFMVASSHRYHQLLTPFPVPLPTLEDEEKPENSNLLIMAWCFWWPVPSQEPPRSLTRVTSLEWKMFLVFSYIGIYKGFRSSAPETGGKRSRDKFSIISHPGWSSLLAFAEWLKLNMDCCRVHLQSLALSPLSAPHCRGHQIPQALRDVYFRALQTLFTAWTTAGHTKDKVLPRLRMRCTL